MEKSSCERETRDFMNVESFSQLPFIRPAPVNKEKSAIRLFGKEFRGESVANDEAEPCEDTVRAEGKESDNNGDIGRKFECHYCCRNFPTSQALGGHQNAHKRERQNAKRAHLQSAILQGAGLSAEAHVYGLVNYRLGSAPPAAMAYRSWSNRNYSYTTADPSRLYGTQNGSYTQTSPIDGNPAALALWRIQSAHSSPTFIDRERLMHHLPFSNNEMKPSLISSPNSQRYESRPSMQDGHVSLDLHL